MSPRANPNPSAWPLVGPLWPRRAGWLGVFLLTTTSACGTGDEGADRGSEAESAAAIAFEALQVRGEGAMGVDQYIAVHQFDALDDGGRIELQHGEDDPEAIATIRAHLKEIAASFAAGDFSVPALVHDMPVPGTDVMAARREQIRYEFKELPRGGGVRIFTEDAEAREAIRAFMAFQRMDHRADGMDHSTHGADHSAPGGH